MAGDDYANKVRKARRAIVGSWVFAAAVAAVVGELALRGSRIDDRKAGLIILSGYLAWSLYWGWLPAWAWWSRRTARFAPLAVLWTPTSLVDLLFIYLPVLGAIAYGALGGGVKEYRKRRRIIREAVHDLPGRRESGALAADRAAEERANGVSHPHDLVKGHR